MQNYAQTIEQIDIDALIPYARNSRTHSETQVAQVAASIREFGFTNPVLIDSDGGIIAGHGRVLAARKLGMGSVPAIRIDYMTDAQKRAYVIADNKLALNAGWDEELLALELGDLQAEGFDLALTGFDDDELAALDRYARRIGLAFQVIDDVLDCEADSATLGKTAGKDAAHDKPTYVSLMGLGEARSYAHALLADAHEALALFGARARRLQQLADYIVARSF